MADSDTKAREMTIPPLRPAPIAPSNSDAPVPESTTGGDKASPPKPENGSIPSPTAAPSMTLVNITKTNGERLQIVLLDDWRYVTTATTGARGGSHWSWAGPQGALIVKIEDVSHITITPQSP